MRAMVECVLAVRWLVCVPDMLAEEQEEKNMTLKEKIAEIKPDKISVHFYAGVYGCPAEYYVLHGSLEKDEIEMCACPEGLPFQGGVNGCVKCWNRPYIEPEVQDA